MADPAREGAETGPLPSDEPHADAVHTLAEQLEALACVPLGPDVVDGLHRVVVGARNVISAIESALRARAGLDARLNTLRQLGVPDKTTIELAAPAAGHGGAEDEGAGSGPSAEVTVKGHRIVGAEEDGSQRREERTLQSTEATLLDILRNAGLEWLTVAEIRKRGFEAPGQNVTQVIQKARLGLSHKLWGATGVEVVQTDRRGPSGTQRFRLNPAVVFKIEPPEAADDDSEPDEGEGEEAQDAADKEGKGKAVPAADAPPEEPRRWTDLASYLRTVEFDDDGNTLDAIVAAARAYNPDIEATQVGRAVRESPTVSAKPGPGGKPVFSGRHAKSVLRAVLDNEEAA